MDLSNIQPAPQNHQQLLPLPIINIKRELTCALSFLVLLLSSILFFSFINPFQAQSFALLSQILPNSQKSSDGDCDYSMGRWVRDESYPLRSYTENCPFLDPGFRCRQNGRKDDEFLKWRWQPDLCDLPR